MFSARLGFMRPDSVPAGIAWGPSDITSANIVAWFDATDPNDYITESNRVVELIDKSGNGIKMVQAEGARQGLEDRTAIPSINFDGVNDKYSGINNNDNLSTPLSFNNSYAIFGVQKIFKTTATQHIMSLNGGFETHATIYFNNNNQYGTVRHPDSDNNRPYGYLHPTVWQTNEYHLCYHRYAGADVGSDLWDFSIDGGDYRNVVKPLSSLDDYTRISIGCLNSLHRPTGDSNFAKMLWNKTMLFDKSLSQDDLQKLEGWAAHQLGLTDNLPADHPYKTLAPEK